MRILPEWKGYDTEIKELQEKLSYNQDEERLPHFSSSDGDPSNPREQKHVHKEL